MVAAHLERRERVRAAFLAALDPLGHPAFATSLDEAVAAVGAALKEPWSRRLEADVLGCARAAGARLIRVGTRKLLRGVRRRGRTVAEAVADGRAVRAWARASRSRA